ncbi:MAG TPA: PTS system mannose/fructose/sorbose family transporter subunit IID [Smithella sp.]|nr:PTS system mannose/fructose/sorbose family transporter subunit IID [Smithella sp.]MDM7987113.1 PTS system mannose/fructose/sorbose family transporter subunit IID [Smithella sp.]HNY50558.1 PTS system mannose/fructose/sorbose family transporter subunit IID [Smithella sp.]HOG90280.1 PTS system mannose/fructose/sorbose family transporter subunit IID [Smithella sp.]HOU51039.1 PTS system mannose/fructose/sorbose family transporter subunit IID [Smithella sp.]
MLIKRATLTVNNILKLFVFEGLESVRKTTLLNIFFRSLFIHVTLNFRRMQNLGFAMAVIPLIRALKLTEKESAEFLTRHLQMFNTHPYFTAPIIGSIVRLEEEHASQKDELFDANSIKQGFMASYAAIGDTFFWGAFRPFVAFVSVLLMSLGLTLAPVFYLLIYTPVHFLVRWKGFFEGYSRGKRGFEFIRSLNLPAQALKIRWISLGVLMALLVWIARNDGYWPFVQTSGMVVKCTALAAVLLCMVLLQKGISQIQLLYGAVGVFIIMAWTGLIH